MEDPKVSSPIDISRVFGDPSVVAMISTRHHGNMKLTSNEGEDNRKKFMKYVSPSVSDTKAFIANVVHGTEIRVLNGTPGNGFVNGIDALINPGIKGAFVGVTYADCPPIFLFGKMPNGNPAVAAIHSGYKSTLGKIGFKAVNRMAELGIKRKTIQAFIGPRICGGCYEFKEEDRYMFSEYPTHYVKPKENNPEKVLVDLSGIIQEQLKMSGVRYIYVSPDCTFESGHLFSQRRDKKDPIEAGVAMIGIKKY